MAAREIRAGRAFVELTLRSKIEGGLKRASQQLKSFGAGIASVGTKLAGIGAGVLTGLAGLVTVFANVADSLDKMSKRTGFSVEALSELSFAAEQSGADVDTLEKVISRMQRSLVDAEDGGNETADAIKDMGLSVKQLLTLSPEDQLSAFADALANIEDPTRRAALAQTTLGKSATKLLPLLSSGADGMAELRQQARDLGLSVSTADASLGAELTDTLNELWRTLKALAFTIGAALAKKTIELVKAMVQFIVAAKNWVDNNRAMIVAIAKLAVIMTGAGIAIVALGLAISGVGSALGALASVIAIGAAAFALLKAAVLILLTPIGLLVAAIIGIGAAAIYMTGAGAAAIEYLTDRFKSLRDTVVKAFGGIADAIASGDLALAAKIAWLTVKLVTQQGIGELKRLWTKFKTEWQKLSADIFYGSVQIASDGFARLQRVLARSFAGIKSLYVNLGAWLGKWWASRSQDEIDAQAASMKAAGRAAAERIAALKREEALRSGAKEGSEELFQIELDREQAIARSDSKAEDFRLGEAGKEKQSAADQTAADLAQIQTDLAAREAEIDTAFADRTRAIEDSLSQALANIASDLQDETGDTAEAIAKARAEWEAAIEQARQQRQARDDENAKRTPFNFELPTIGEQAEQQKARAVGAFDTAAVKLLGKDSSVAVRTAKASEETARHTREMARLINFGGATFA